MGIQQVCFTINQMSKKTGRKNYSFKEMIDLCREHDASIFELMTKRLICNRTGVYYLSEEGRKKAIEYGMAIRL